MYDKACVFRNAEVYGWALIYNNAIIYDNTQVTGCAQVYDNAEVYEYARIGDNAKIHGRATVSSNAMVWEDAEIFRLAMVNDSAMIRGNAKIESHNDYIVFKNWWSSGRYFTWTRSNNMWSVGCFYGTGDELIKKAYKDSKSSGNEYKRVVKYVKTISSKNFLKKLFCNL